MKTGNDLTPPASYKALIVGDIDDPQTNYVVVLYAYNIISIFITNFVPRRHAKKHVRLHRNSKCHVGEQLSFKSPRKK